MKNRNTLTTLVLLIIVISAIVSYIGIYSDASNIIGSFKSIRGIEVPIYGKGLYKHMSSEVAIQGIAQDYITLFFGIPLLIISFIGTRKNSIRFKYLLSGTIGYFLVTYLFYLSMAMYNECFLGYVILLGASFFAFLISLNNLTDTNSNNVFEKTPSTFVGGFLIFNSIMIALLWLSSIIPPLIDSSIYPKLLEHYTTLIVQGFDLALLLPLSFVSGYLLLKGKNCIFGTVYIIFLSLLMTALSAKIIAMGLNGYNIIPVIFIIPTFNIISLALSVVMLKRIKT